MKILVGIWIGYDADLIANGKIVIDLRTSVQTAGVSDQITTVCALNDSFFPYVWAGLNGFSVSDHAIEFCHFEFYAVYSAVWTVTAAAVDASASQIVTSRHFLVVLSLNAATG